MAEGGLKGSRSAEGLNKPAKPGRLSTALLNKFESDPSLGGPQPLSVGHARLSAQSFTSSSEEIAASSQEHIKSTSVRIKVPADHSEEHLSPSSADEGIVSDDEAGKKKKRKSRWKWSPFKKMRKLFRRKKSPTRVKSVEELPTARYKPTYLVPDQEEDDSLRNRTKSEPSLVETKTKGTLATIDVYERRNTVNSPVQRTRSEPSRQSLGKLLKVQGKSQDSISEEPAMSSDERISQAGSVSAGLDWSMISSDSGTEAAVSFENLPSASSLEGLQAAHDRIKIAPKHRRPPTRAHPKSSSMNVKRNPVKPHRRSKTDPKDLSATSAGTESTEGLAGSRSSDIVNATIFEASEISDDNSKEKVVADMKAKASEILSNVPKSPRVSEKQLQNAVSNGDEVVPDGEGEKKLSHIQTEGDKNQESADEHLKDSHENKANIVVNKENEAVQSSKSNVHIENKEEPKTQETVLKELNVKKDESRPLLDITRRSKSLKNFGIKDRSLESIVKPPLQRGLSLDSTEQNNDKSEEKPDADVKLVVEKDKPNKTGSVHEDKTRDSKNSGEKISPAGELESKASIPPSVIKSIDADKPSTGVKLREKGHEKDDSSEQPAWIKLANRKSERMSQLLETNDNKGSMDVDAHLSTTTDNKPAVREKPKIPTKPQIPTNKKTPVQAPQQSNIKVDKKPAPFGKSHSEDETKAPNKDRCVVCGRTVYQMEKCNLDSSVLHKQCVKCSVCKRLLTVGNFVIAESKVYCKPHAHTAAATVSSAL